jgi:uncharacterized spore protein YtfJ
VLLAGAGMTGEVGMILFCRILFMLKVNNIIGNPINPNDKFAFTLLYN